MKIAIIGAGAIGSVVAAYLSKSGVDVCLIGRENQVQAIKKNGLLIKGAKGEENLKIPVATKLEREYDLAIFATKTQDMEAAYQENCDYLENCLVLSTQNGVQADNILSSHFDRDRMLTSIVMFGSTYTKPGEIIINFDGDWIVGRPFGPIDPTMHKVADVLRKAFRIVVTDNVVGMKYTKLFVNFNNCIMAVLNRSMQEAFKDMDFCRLSVRLLREGVDIVQKAKISLASLPEFPVERIFGLAKMPEEQAAQLIHQSLTKLSDKPIYGSILQSIMRGKTSEIDFINGEVVQLARHLHADAHLNARMVEMVHEVERTGNFYRPDDVKEIFQLAGKGL